MALEFVGGKAVGFAGTTSDTAVSLTDLTGGLASAPADGDVVVVVYSVAGTSDLSIGVTTSGYTERQELYQNAGGQDANLSVSYKRMGATPDTSVSVSGTGSTSNGGAVAIHVWRGVDPTTPFDVIDTTDGATGTDRPDPPSITPATSGAVVLACGGGGSFSGGTFTSSDLSNFVTANGSDSNTGNVGLGSFAWTSGAFNPAQFGGGAGANSNRSWAAASLALRPQTATQYTLTADAGAFTLTGSAAAPVAARRLSAAPGAYSLTGADADLRVIVHYNMATDAGSFAVAGNAATLRADRRLLAGTLPTFVDAGAAASGVGDVVVPVPASFAAGDLLILAVETADEAVAIPSSWSEHPSSPLVTDDTFFGTTRLTVFYKFADGTETSATITDPGDHALGAMIAVRNAEPSDPFGDTGINLSGNLPPITPGTRGTLVVAIYASAKEGGYAGFGWQNIITAVEEERINAETLSGNAGSLGIWTAPFNPSVSSNLTTEQFSASGGGLATGIHFAITPKGSPGEFSLTGSAATLRRGYNLVAATGAFALAGVTATLRAARKLAVDAGSFTLTGEDAALRRGFTLIADAGAFLLTGAAAGSRRTYVWAVEAGTFALTGAAAALRVARKIVADVGQFIFTGSDVEFDAIQRDLTDEPSTERIFCVEGEDRTVIIEPERERIFACSACQPRVTTVDGSRPRITVLEAGSSRTVTLPPEERRTIA